MNKKLIGKWQMVCWKINGPGGWKTLKNYSDNQCIWDFKENGKLIELIVGEHRNITKYYHYPDELLLAIDRSDYADDGYMLTCIEERYRVESLSDRYMILYDLEDVKVEPDDYTMKVELEKV